MSFDISVFKKNKNFRYLFLGQAVSYLGSLISITVVPIQVYRLTHSSAMVGLVSLVELVPLLLAAFVGGVLADRLDRKKLLVICEAVMALGVAGLGLNSLLAQPSLVFIFVVSALIQATNGFHRPAMDSVVQAILKPEEIPVAAALTSFRMGFTSLIGPSLGGLLISTVGAPFAYGFDFLTFVISVWALRRLDTRHLGRAGSAGNLISSLREGLVYAWSRPEILGTYLIDMAAMTFAFPMALFPSVSEGWGRPGATGLMYSALTLGSLAMPFLSGWSSRVRRQGRVIIIAAVLWGLGIVLFGLAPNFWWGLIFLALAGAADVISGLFRMMIWNQTIPNEIRGRMAGLEMMSYMSGPLLGNARAGWVASATSNQFSLVSGGLLCVLIVIIVAVLLPRFTRYVRPEA